jgi:SAM-dependent methyltransferase
MREHVRAFVNIAAECFTARGPVYEFGSYLVGGAGGPGDLRGCFPGREFIGCDMREGPGVDRIEDLGSLNLPDGAARTIVCVDTLEHVFEVRRAADEMLRVLAPGGLILIAVPLDFRIHDYPSDYWRLTPSCLERLLAPLDATLVGWQGVDSYPHTVFAVGAKSPLSVTFAQGAQRFMSSYQQWLREARERVTLRRRLKRRLLAWLRSKGERRRLACEHEARFVLHLHVDGHGEHDWRHAVHELTDLGSRLDVNT